MNVKHSAQPLSSVDTVMPLAMHLLERLKRQGALQLTAVSTVKSGLANSAALSVFTFLPASALGSYVVQAVPLETAMSLAQQQ